MIVQRVALWFPEKVLAVASVCVPFTQPQGTYIPIKQLVKRLPNFAYQIYFASPEAEQDLSSPENIERFLKALYRVNGDGPISWNSDRNLVAGLGNPTLSKLWETQDVWKFYLSSFQRVGSLRGPLTYYKTRELNYNDELGLEGKERIQCPAMFVGAMDDRALPPAMWENQQWVPHLERHAVGGGHWCLVENGGTEVGKVIQKWVTKVSNTSSKL
jgi:pimeloyl-ACP methyl ester carboxylesterase